MTIMWRRRHQLLSTALNQRIGYFVLALQKHERAIAWCAEKAIPIAKAQNEGTMPGGAVLVPAEIRAGVFEYADVSGVVRRNARQQPMGSDHLTIPILDDSLTLSFTGENAETSDSDYEFRSITLTPRKLTALNRLSSELFEDAAAEYGAMVAEDLGRRFATVEDNCAFNGTGSVGDGGMRGLCTLLADGGHAGSVVTAGSGHDTFAELDASDLALLMSALPERYWPSASFYVSGYGAAMAFVRLGATSAGVVMTLDGPRPLMHFGGFPIEVVPQMPGAGDQSGKVMIAFGSMRDSTVFGLRRALEVRTTLHRYIERDQVGLLARERFDLNHWHVGDADDAGAIVGLLGE